MALSSYRLPSLNGQIECDKARIEIAAGMAVREADQAGRDDDIVDEFRNDLLASSSDYSSMQALQVDDIMKEIYYRPPRNPKTAAQNVLQKRGPQHNAADDGGSLISDDEYCTADTVDRPVLYTEGVDDSRQGTAGARNARNPHHTGSDSQHFDMTSPATSHPIGVRYKGPTKRYPPVYVDGETAKSSFFNRDTVLSLAAASAISLGTLVYIRPELPSEAMKTLAHGARYALSSLGSALDKVRGWGGETNSNGIASAILGTAVANSIS